jgi:NDP-sugar pyrophosphorylase family protein
MKAMILAAGLGTRLRPLTENTPKALMPVANVPALGRNIEYLKGYGIDRIVVNAHHHHDQIVTYLDRGRPFGLDIEVRVEQEILGTGGGIGNTAGFWDQEPFFVLNSDILTDIDLGPAYAFHRDSGALATMVLHDYGPFNQVLLDPLGNIAHIANAPLSGGLAFTGIHIINPDLLTLIPEGFSDIITCYRQVMDRGEGIKGYLARGHLWRDIGTLESYIAANQELSPQPFTVASNCLIGSSAKFMEWGVVGENARIGEGAQIRRSILWDGVRIKKGIKVVDSVVTANREVANHLTGEVF